MAIADDVIRLTWSNFLLLDFSHILSLIKSLFRITAIHQYSGFINVPIQSLLVILLICCITDILYFGVLGMTRVSLVQNECRLSIRKEMGHIWQFADIRQLQSSRSSKSDFHLDGFSLPSFPGW